MKTLERLAAHKLWDQYWQDMKQEWFKIEVLQGLPSGDLMMFDNKRVAVCAYDQTGRMTKQTFYNETDDITNFLQLKHDLLVLARPLLP